MGKLRLLGATGLHQQQSLTLLCYLALEGPSTRRHLSTIFWPHARQPLNNLSSALTRIRKVAPNTVDVDDNIVSTALTIDASGLADAISAGDTEQILSAYNGHFLQTTELRAIGIELEEWIFSTREALARAASGALLSAAGAAETPGDAAELAVHAHRIGGAFWVDAETWSRCHALVAHADLVTAQQVRIDARQFGVELQAPDPNSALPNSHALPSEPGRELFGRQAELDALHDFISDSSSFWMTMIGMGGVGKTTAARAFCRQVAATLPRFATLWISLAGVNSLQGVATALAVELGLSSEGDEDVIAELRQRCSNRGPVIVVLDNLEQVVDSQVLLQKLSLIEGLRVIVTSRVATGHHQERLLVLRGLESERSAAGHALFLDRARPHDPAAGADHELVTRVCELVQGLPLAIELCAAWLRTIPLPVVVESLQGSTSLVATSPSDSLESMQSILERSWNLLDAARARTLGRLALFEAPFDYAAAQAVAGDDLTVIADLVGSSLIDRHDDLLVLHPLVRRFALERLRSGDPLAADAAEASFVGHAQKTMVAAAAKLRGPEAGNVSPSIAVGLDNVIAAWRLAIHRRAWGAVAKMADGIDQHLRSASQQWRTARLFDEALEAMDAPLTADPEASAAIVAVGWRRAMVGITQGQREAASALIDKCVVARGEDDASGAVGLNYVQGQLAMFEGRYTDAAAHLEAARLGADGNVDEWFVAEVDAALALAAMALDQTDRARMLLRSVLDTGRRLGNPVNITSAYYFLGSVEFVDDPQKALLLLEEGRLVAERASLAHISRKCATIIGRCHILLGNPEAALVVFEEALADDSDASSVREPWVRIANQVGVGMAWTALGERANATRHFSEAVRTEVALEDWPLLLETCLEVCRLRIDQADQQSWLDLLHLVAEHPASMREWKRDVDTLLDQTGRERIVDITTAGPTPLSAPGDDASGEATRSTAATVMVDATSDAAVEQLRIDVVGEQVLALLRA